MFQFDGWSNNMSVQFKKSPFKEQITDKGHWLCNTMSFNVDAKVSDFQATLKCTDSH